MPNWCHTSMTIEGPKAEIEGIHMKIKECYQGLITSMDEEITARQDEPGIYYFQVQYDSAWTEKNETLEIVLEKFAPNCDIYYVAEELGYEYYVTNDRNKKYYANEIIIMSYLEQSNPLYQKWNAEFGETEYTTRQVLKEQLTQIFGQMPLKKLIRKAKAIPRTDNENEYVEIFQVQYV